MERPNARSHICAVVSRFPQRSETFVRNHVASLRARAHEVSVISGGPGFGIARQEMEVLDRSGIRRLEYGSPSTRLMRIARIISTVSARPSLIPILWKKTGLQIHELLEAVPAHDLARSVCPHILHVHFGHTAAGLFHVAQVMGSLPPTVVTWHGYDANVLPKTRNRRLYERLFASEAHHTVGSEFMCKRLIELGAEDDLVHKIPMGVDLRHFNAPERHRNPAQPLHVVSIGRLHEVKGHEHLIRAIGRLQVAGEGVALRIVGDGPQRHKLSALIEALGLQDSVTLVGSVPSVQVQQELSRADLFVLASAMSNCGSVETQGVALIEAQAMGLPVISCDVGGVAESLRDGETGFLCPARDVDALSRSIQQFCRNPDWLVQFGQRGREFVERQFSIESMIDSFEGLYDRLSEN